MDSDEENRMEDVPERPLEPVEVTLPLDPERTSDVPRSWAERVANEDPGVSPSDEEARAAYPAHLISEVNTFHGVMPSQSLGELSHDDQLRLFRLNGVPSRPCSARFTLADNTLDSKTILDRIVSIGIPRQRVTCIQRFSLGLVDVTFAKKDLRDLFLSKISTPFRQRTAPRMPVWDSGVFVTVRDAPWELPDDLVRQRLEQYGIVHSIRRAFNQSLLPEKVPDGRRVLRMTVEQPIPSFMKFGPYLVRIFYPGQPRVCWKCGSPDHFGRDCPDFYCFNCDQSGHRAHACGEHIKCSLCKSEEHLAIDCPGNWGRRTLAQRSPIRAEEWPEEPGSEDDQGGTEVTATSEDDQGSEGTAISEDDEIPNSSPEELELSSADEHSDDTVHEVCDIEQFTSSDDVEPQPTPRKRGSAVGGKPQVKKKSRVEERPP